MKDDTISRAAALTALNGCTEIYLNNLPPTIYKGDAVDAIKALPSAQPGCEDAVSRFEVLRLIDYSSNDLNDSVDNWYFQGKVKELPSVTPKQPGWIPTSERLPDNDRAVLVTLKWAEDDYEVAVGEYWHNSTASHGWGSFEGHVIAWHELPTPYREGGQYNGSD